MFTLSLLFVVWIAWVYAVGVVFVDLWVRAIVVFLITIFYGLVVGAFGVLARACGLISGFWCLMVVNSVDLNRFFALVAGLWIACVLATGCLVLLACFNGVVFFGFWVVFCGVLF